MGANDNVLKTLIDSLVNQLQNVLIKLNEIDSTTKRIESSVDDIVDNTDTIKTKTPKLDSIDNIALDIASIKGQVQTTLSDLQVLKQSISPVSKLSSYLATPLGIILFLFGLVVATTALNKSIDYGWSRISPPTEKKEMILFYTPCNVDHINTHSTKSVPTHFHPVTQ